MECFQIQAVKLYVKNFIYSMFLIYVAAYIDNIYIHINKLTDSLLLIILQLRF